jgi:predicted amidophosphoribosyltransferase
MAWQNMASQYMSFQRTCSICGGRLKRTTTRCPTCNRNQVPVTTKLTILFFTLLSFALFCWVIYHSARHSIGRH